MKFFVFLTLISTFAFADKTIERTEVVNKTVLFSIEDMATKDSLELGKNVENSFLLKRTFKGKKKQVKFSSNEGEALDQEFSKIFLDFQYIMGLSTDKSCNRAFAMLLRSEGQVVCAHEKAKVDLMNKFLSKIRSYF
jgi:hypothetical protein